MTTLLDQDRHARARTALRASSVALGLVASVGLQLAGAPVEPPRVDETCRATANATFAA